MLITLNTATTQIAAAPAAPIVTLGHGPARTSRFVFGSVEALAGRFAR